jgi:hypothetical protein
MLADTLRVIDSNFQGKLIVSSSTPSSLESHALRVVRFRRAAGTVLTLNFSLFWLLPIALQGQIYKLGLRRVLEPVYDRLDRSEGMRRFAAKWIYQRPVHVDYFARAVLLLLSTSIALGVVFYWQVTHGSLPVWLVGLYYFAWVGFGGRIMGAAYTFAHREGHRPGGRLYRPWIRNSFGNVFENWLGLFYGNVPYNFSTSHNLLHHKLDAGKGDPFYMWDIDRTSWSDFMLYQFRVFSYMTGWSSLEAFRKQSDRRQMADSYRALLKGFVLYWGVVPGLVFTGLVQAGCTPLSSLAFLFFIYVQPLCAMAFFLAAINIGFHGFIEFDEAEKHVECVASSTIIDGEDDSFGEDDHMAHHYFTAVEHPDLERHQQTQHEEWARNHASVFKELAIVELALFILLGKFDLLAEKHYVDYSGGLSSAEIAGMLEERAKRKEMSYEEYEFVYLPSLRSTAEELVRRGTCSNLGEAYRYQAHHNLRSRFDVAA